MFMFLNFHSCVTFLHVIRRKVLFFHRNIECTLCSRPLISKRHYKKRRSIKILILLSSYFGLPDNGLSSTGSLLMRGNINEVLYLLERFSVMNKVSLGLSTNHTVWWKIEKLFLNYPLDSSSCKPVEMIMI